LEVELVEDPQGGGEAGAELAGVGVQVERVGHGVAERGVEELGEGLEADPVGDRDPASDGRFS